MNAQPSSTRRLTVNAAFLKDIKDDNRDLKILVDRLRCLTQPRETASNHWDELVRLIADLRDQLAMHFGLEEAFGYFDAAIDADPELSCQAEVLKLQHAGLFEAARHLAESVADVSKIVPAVGEVIEGKTPEVTPAQEKILDRLQRLLLDFHQHEEAELKLILDALDDDLGVGD